MGVPLFGNVDEIRHGFKGRLYGIGFSFPLLQGLNFVLLVYLIYRYSKKHFAGWLLVPILWILFLTALTGYRWLCILFIMAPLTGYNYIVGRFKFNLKTFGVIIIVAIIILSSHGLLGYQRSITKRTESEYLRNLESVNIPSEFKYFAPALLSLQCPPVSFSRLLNLVPQEQDYFYGRYILAQIPIIQRLFPSLSRENVSVYVTDTIFGYDYRAGSGGTALTIIGSLYIDFGPLAIIVGMTIIGFFLEITYLRAAETPSLLNITVYSFLLWTVIKWIVAGACVGDLLILLMILAIDKLIRKRQSSVY
jgi:oligosaccharide repeat unit polymerase